MQSFRHFLASKLSSPMLESRERPIIFVDLDGTLVHTSFRPQWPEMLLPLQCRKKIDHFRTLRDIRLEFLSKPVEKQLQTMKSLGGISIPGDIEAVTFLRPGAKKFLIECMGIARTCIITQGKQSFQEQVVNAVDLPIKDLFGNIAKDDHVNYGNKVPQSSTAILIDDMPLESALVQRKLKAIGLTNSERFVKIEGWEGLEGDKHDFDDILKRIRYLVKD